MSRSGSGGGKRSGKTAHSQHRGSGRHERKVLPELGIASDPALMKELQQLESFFGMNDEQLSKSVTDMFQSELPPRDELSRPATSGGDLGSPLRRQLPEAECQKAPSLAAAALSPAPPSAASPAYTASSVPASPSAASPALWADDRPSSSQHRSSTWYGPSVASARDFSLNLAREALAQISGSGVQALDDTKARKNRVHRPVTSQELADAAKPRVIAMPPIFHKASDKTRESHYAFFARKIPGERPDHRRIMWGRAACARKVYHFNEIIGAG